MSLRPPISTIATFCVGILLVGFEIPSPFGHSTAKGDVIKLKNAGELRGLLEDRTATSSSPEITINTLTGGVVVVPGSRVEFITRRPLILEEYEVRAQIAEDTVEGQWAIAEWCRKNRLREQRATHLERIVELDPDNEAAHYGLGHTKRNGRWTTREEVMTALGYVKHKGRYVTPEELELIEKTAAERAAEREWFAKVRLWHSWVTGRYPKKVNDGVANLKQITDPNAISALQKIMSDDTNTQVRGLYVEILAGIRGLKPISALVRQAMLDIDATIRSAALAAIDESRRKTAIAYIVDYLRNDTNTIVRRAAAALGKIGNDDVIPYLVEALNTTHKYKVQVDAPGYGAQAGSVLPPQVELMLRTGQFPDGVIINQPQTPRVKKTVTLRVNQQNPEALAALQRLTGENFGYNERTWKLWWVSEKNKPGG